MAQGYHDAVIDAYQKATDTGNDYPLALLDLYKAIGIRHTPTRNSGDNRKCPPELLGTVQDQTTVYVIKFLQTKVLTPPQSEYCTAKVRNGPPYSDIEIAKRQQLEDCITQQGVDHFTHQRRRMAIWKQYQKEEPLHAWNIANEYRIQATARQEPTVTSWYDDYREGPPYTRMPNKTNTND